MFDGTAKSHDDLSVEDVRTMIGAGATTDQVEAVDAVMRRAGLVGPCEAVVGGQGEGIAVIIIQTSVSTFLSVFLQPTAEGARERLKQFFRDIHAARNDREAYLRQVYVRPETVTPEEWAATRPQGRPTGFPKERLTEPEITLSDLMSDEGWDALLDIDFETLAPGSYGWNDCAKEWQLTGEG